jgi:hypothetical protein
MSESSLYYKNKYIYFKVKGPDLFCNPVKRTL